MYVGQRSREVAAQRGSTTRRPGAARRSATSRVAGASSSRATTTASRDAGMPRERGLDLAELDAEAAHLDLVVDPAEELERAVAAASARGRRCGRGARRASRERVGDEPLGRQLRPAEVAAREAVAADVQLAGDADGHRLAARASRT